MLSVNIIQFLLITVYLFLMVNLGVLTADEELVNSFEGSKVYLWYGLLIFFYGGLILFTNWIMSFLTQLSYKISYTDKESFSQKLIKEKALWYLISVYYTHILVLYIQYYLGSSFWAILLFVIPITYIFIALIMDRQIIGIKKLVAMLPILIYIALDIITITKF